MWTRQDMATLLMVHKIVVGRKEKTQALIWGKSKKEKIHMWEHLKYVLIQY